MTSASVALLPETSAARSNTWPAEIFEFLVIGGATLFLFPVAWILRAVLGADFSLLAVSFTAFYAAHVINDPHFAVTYFLFYKDAKQRAFGNAFSPLQRLRYVLAGIVVPIVLLAWGMGAIVQRSAFSMGLLIQLMFFLVGWHYVKQGFGVLAVLSARRGVSFSLVERRVILTHCFSGWAYGWASPFDPGRTVEEKGVVYSSIAQPHGLELATGVVFGLSTLALIFVLAKKWRRERRLAFAPLIGFLVTIWLWTVFTSLDPLMIYVIPGLHSVQYLYFVWLLKRNQARHAEGPPLFGTPTGLRLAILAGSALTLGWILFHGAPTLLDGLLADPKRTKLPEDLGATPYFAALFAFVNIHHYFMDHVIWRRENPDTRFLRGPACRVIVPARA